MREKKRDPRISVRVALLVELGDRILLAMHEKGGRQYWVFPGGRLTYGETLEECGRRELMEEGNIQVRVGSLLYLSDRSSEGRVDVNLFFRGYLEGGDLKLGNDPEVRGDKVLKRLAFVSAEEFRALEVFPPEVKRAVLNDWGGGFPATGRYLGYDE